MSVTYFAALKYFKAYIARNMAKIDARKCFLANVIV